MKLEKAYKKLLIEHPFYGLFLLGMSKATDESVPTACVRKKGINCELVVNPKFWESLDDTQQINVLMHEIYHIVFQHMFLYNSFSNKERFNIAADCEVNSYIDNIDEQFVHPYKWNLPVKKGTKFYYDNLPSQENPSAGASMDDHSKWDSFNDCSEAEKEIIKNQLNSQLKEAAEQTQKMQGKIPNELTDIIKELFKVKPRIFNWKVYFRRMLGSIYDINIKKTRRKESIRFPESAGLKHKKKVSILVAVDTSGSVNNQELTDFFSEINHIYKAGARITILECDAVITNQYEYTGSWTGEVHGRGGTNFQPVIDFYRKYKKEYSSLVYFTDGECSLPTNVPRDVIWVITSEGEHKEYPGKTLYIPKNQ